MAAKRTAGACFIACTVGLARLAHADGADAQATVGVSASTPSNTPVSVTPAAGAPDERDPLWYVRVGGGAMAQKGLAGGPAFGFGLRYGLGHLAVDASLFNLLVTKQDATFDNLNGSWIKAGATWYATPAASASPFIGAGVGWGVTSATIDSIHYGNSGLDFGVWLGLELMRGRAFRLFVQADAELPAYSSHGYVFTNPSFPTQLQQDSVYTPSFTLSLGFGFAHPKTP